MMCPHFKKKKIYLLDPRDYKALDFADRDLTLLLDFTQRRTCFQVEIIDDTTAEGSTPESFQVQLTILATQTSDLQRVIATPALATISIEDNEAEISVGFEQTSFDVDESVGSIQVCVRLMISNQSRIDDSFGVRFMISEESTAGTFYYLLSEISGYVVVPTKDHIRYLKVTIINGY